MPLPAELVESLIASAWMSGRRQGFSRDDTEQVVRRIENAVVELGEEFMREEALERLRALAEGNPPPKRMPKSEFRAYLDQLYATNKFFKKTADRLKRDENLRDPMKVAYSIGIKTGGWPGYKRGDAAVDAPEAPSAGGRDSKGRFRKKSSTSSESPAEAEGDSGWGDIPGLDKIRKGLKQIGKATTDYAGRIKGDLTYGRKDRERVKETEGGLEGFKKKKRAGKEKPWKSSLPQDKPYKPKRRK